MGSRTVRPFAHTFRIGCVSCLIAGVFITCVVARARKIVQNRTTNRKHDEGAVACTLRQGPMVDANDLVVKKEILQVASKRTLWKSLRGCRTSQMIGQVGGLSENKRPSLLVGNTFLLKPLRTDHRGLRELLFYETVLSCANNSSYVPYFDTCVLYKHTTNLYNLLDFACLAFVGLILRDAIVRKDVLRILSVFEQIRQEKQLLAAMNKFLPEYYGIVKCIADGTSNWQGIVSAHETHLSANSYLVLRDLTSSFDTPCVMDIKLGTESYEPDAPTDKRLREERKYPQQVEFGFRIVGMRIYQPTDEDSATTATATSCADGYVSYDKHFGRSLGTVQDVKKAFISFFSPGRRTTAGVVANTPNRLQVNVIETILAKLESLLGWFDGNNTFCFYASSVLLVYEAGSTSSGLGNDDFDDNYTATSDNAAVKLIDFGRVRRNKGGDVGCTKGLTTLIDLLQELRTER